MREDGEGRDPGGHVEAARGPPHAARGAKSAACLGLGNVWTLSAVPADSVMMRAPLNSLAHARRHEAARSPSKILLQDSLLMPPSQGEADSARFPSKGDRGCHPSRAVQRAATKLRGMTPHDGRWHQGGARGGDVIVGWSGRVHRIGMAGRAKMWPRPPLSPGSY